MADVLDPENIAGPQKAAIFLLAMGEDFASGVFEKMNDQQISDVVFEMSKITNISPEMLKAVCIDFVERFEGDTKMIVEGDSFIKNVVSRTMKGDQAKALLDDLERKKQDKPFIWSRNVNVATLAGYVEGEHPQTVAMILAHMPAEISSEILMSLPEEKKGDIALRIAKLGQISEDVVRDVDRALKTEMSGAVGPGGKVCTENRHRRNEGKDIFKSVPAGR
ncbi:MAG: hypothetical protein LC660_15065 [Desulfobacteraceae bacterium]|nr:hypothetical protein [Desulfobacteraceae bacterium]